MCGEVGWGNPDQFLGQAEQNSVQPNCVVLAVFLVQKPEHLNKCEHDGFHLLKMIKQDCIALKVRLNRLG